VGVIELLCPCFALGVQSRIRRLVGTLGTLPHDLGIVCLKIRVDGSEIFLEGFSVAIKAVWRAATSDWLILAAFKSAVKVSICSLVDFRLEIDCIIRAMRSIAASGV